MSNTSGFRISRRTGLPETDEQRRRTFSGGSHVVNGSRITGQIGHTTPVQDEHIVRAISRISYKVFIKALGQEPVNVNIEA